MIEGTLEQPQSKKLELEVEKLELDIEKLRDTNSFDKWLTKLLPIIPVTLGIAAFVFGIIQYNNQQKAALLQQKETSEKSIQQREQEILKPLLDKRLELYFEASGAAATIAVSEDIVEKSKAEAKFKQLYIGQMVIVEDAKVENGMVEFYKCLTGQDQCEKPELQKRSLSLASRMRESVGNSFNITLQDLKGKY